MRTIWNLMTPCFCAAKWHKVAYNLQEPVLWSSALRTGPSASAAEAEAAFCMTRDSLQLKSLEELSLQALARSIRRWDQPKCWSFMLWSCYSHTDHTVSLWPSLLSHLQEQIAGRPPREPGIGASKSSIVSRPAYPQGLGNVWEYWPFRGSWAYWKIGHPRPSPNTAYNSK